MKNIIVIGGSRGIGLATVKRLLEEGHNVTAFSRGADQLSFQHERLKKIKGDALNVEQLRKALDGADVVVQALGVPLNTKLLTGPITLFSKATALLVPLMEEMKISRLISVTGFGAGKSAKAIHFLQRIPFNIVFGKAYDDKSKQEDLIERSSLDWTIVRPGVLTDQKFNKNYRVRVDPSDWKNGMISRSAVADYIGQAIHDDGTIHASPVLSN